MADMRTTVRSVVLLSMLVSRRAVGARRRRSTSISPSGWPQGRSRSSIADIVAGNGGSVHLSERGPTSGSPGSTAPISAKGPSKLTCKGKDVFQQSFLGLAFHGKDDKTYESVYVRPFNFRATDPARHDHAVQYMTVPEFDWPRLREQFPEEFENPVNSTLSPTDWVPLRIVVRGQRVQVFVGLVANVTLEVRKLGTLDRGMSGFVGGQQQRR